MTSLHSCINVWIALQVRRNNGPSFLKRILAMCLEHDPGVTLQLNSEECDGNSIFSFKLTRMRNAFFLHLTEWFDSWMGPWFCFLEMCRETKWEDRCCWCTMGKAWAYAHPGKSGLIKWWKTTMGGGSGKMQSWNERIWKTSATWSMEMAMVAREQGGQ